MAAFFRAKCPIDEDKQAWVHSRTRWILHEFGADELQHVRVVLPTPEFFPDPYDGCDEDVEALVHRVCGFMRVDPKRITVAVYSEDEAPPWDGVSAYESSRSGAAGLYIDSGDPDKLLIAIEETQTDDALSVVATAAHELGHVHLLGDGRLRSDEPDHERRTDLLTVFLGMGVFTANTAFRFSQWQEGGYQGWSAQSSGYLSEAEFGYALALLAYFRGDRTPGWTDYLAQGVRHFFKKSERYLSSEPSEELRDLAGWAGR